MISFNAFSDREEAESRVFTWETAQQQLGYTLTRDWDANNCEFYIDSTFGKYFYNLDFYQYTLDFYMHIDSDSLVERGHGQILNLAAYVVDPGSECLVKAKGNIISLCLAGDFPGGLGFGHSVPIQVTGFAFFLDVKRADGSIDRLWLKNGDRNFTLDDVKNYEVGGNSLGKGKEYYVSDASPIFNQKRACQQ